MDTKDKLFERATQKLLQEIDSVGLSQTDRMQAKNFTLLFRDSFKSDAVKRATFGMSIGDDYKLFPYDAYGFCKAASCSFVSLMPRGQWRVMYIDDLWTYGPHYYVQHVATKKNFDLTCDQYEYDGVEIPYYMGRPVQLMLRHAIRLYDFCTQLDWIFLCWQTIMARNDEYAKTRTVR